MGAPFPFLQRRRGKKEGKRGKGLSCGAGRLHFGCWRGRHQEGGIITKRNSDRENLLPKEKKSIGGCLSPGERVTAHATKQTHARSQYSREEGRTRSLEPYSQKRNVQLFLVARRAVIGQAGKKREPPLFAHCQVGSGAAAR